MKNININESQVFEAPLDRVWDVVADVDNDAKYYSGLSDIRNISKEGNKIEREVTVGFLRHKARQTIILNPKKSIELTMTRGPLLGARTTTLNPINGNKTKVDVSWHFTPSGVPVFAHEMVKSEITRGTKEALRKIAEELEQGTEREVKPQS